MEHLQKLRFRENEYVEIWIQQGIVYEILKPGAVLDLEAGRCVVADRLRVLDGVTMPIFIDLTNLVNMDTKTRKFMASNEATRYLTASAFLLNNPINQLVFNIFIKFSPPPIPTKGFRNKGNALQWLTYLKNLN